MERFVEEAIVLGAVDYGDADRIVTLLTRGRGRLSAFAAGARKSKRRFQGALEPATVLRAQLVQRRGDTYRLDGVDVVDSHHRLRDDLQRIGRALYAAELARELARDELAHPELFDLLTGFLRELEGPLAPASDVRFTLGALSLSGVRPSFSPCARCRGPTGDAPAFDADGGGVLCAGCARQAVRAAPVDAAVVELLAGLERGSAPDSSPRQRGEARALLDAYLGWHLGRRLKTVDFLARLGLD